MTTIQLYTGNGKSYSTAFENGMHRADKTRCVADEGKILQLDGLEFYCKDVLNEQLSEVTEEEDSADQQFEENRANSAL